ncbi:broad-spectrum mercury transporter MerE [Enterobacter hormaechei]|nr:broad-spectrum mercury transporter MerE [Enterobacter hormaechei]
MNSPERLPSETHKPITGYLWGALAVLTCPCHLPILAIVLAGTTAGAFIGEYWGNRTGAGHNAAHQPR